MISASRTSEHLSCRSGRHRAQGLGFGVQGGGTEAQNLKVKLCLPKRCVEGPKGLPMESFSPCTREIIRGSWQKRGRSDSELSHSLNSFKGIIWGTRV